ncbi:hypothetical protein ES704_03968 [subsurface metagenome]|jgi:hypothetical protein
MLKEQLPSCRDAEMNTRKETATLEEAKEQVRRVCTRLGLLHLSFAKTLVEELGEKKGKQLVLKAIKDYGTRIGERVKANATAQGLGNDPENYVEDLPLYGMYDDIETKELKGEKRIRVYGCVMGKVWNKLREGELGRLYCYVDPAKYMAFNPNFKLIHTKVVTGGDAYCELVVRPTTEQDREDFAAKDTDWSHIDK